MDYFPPSLTKNATLHAISLVLVVIVKLHAVMEGAGSVESVESRPCYSGEMEEG